MELTDYLRNAVESGASDMFIVAGGPVSCKIKGRIGTERLFPEETKRLITKLYQLANRDISVFLQKGDDDFSFALAGLARFRVNAYRQRGSLATVVRVVAFDIPDWRSLHIPEQVIDLAKVDSGMVLVTGTAGSGKSTTQACIINRINDATATSSLWRTPSSTSTGTRRAS